MFKSKTARELQEEERARTAEINKRLHDDQHPNIVKARHKSEKTLQALRKKKKKKS